MRGSARLLMAAALLLLGGCALTPEKIDVGYAPSVNVQKVSGAENIHASLIVNDVRTNKDRVASKTNAYGTEMAAISTNQDLVSLVRDALRAELTNRGYKIDGSNTQIICDIFDFNNQFRTGFWSGTAEGSVRLNVKVRSVDGNITFSETVTGQGREEKIQLASGKNAKPALEKALKQAIENLMERQDFHRALLRAGGVEQAM